jgi:hypothetical protein
VNNRIGNDRRIFQKLFCADIGLSRTFGISFGKAFEGVLPCEAVNKIVVGMR